MDSLINQTYKNIEIICVDDGSTDGCPAIVDEYAANDSRIVAIHQKNQGLASARNAGLEVLKGEWVTGVDSDDWLEPQTIEKLLSIVDDETDIVWFGLRTVTDSGEVDNPYYRPYLKGKHVITEAIIRHTNVNFCAKLWRVSFIKSRNARFYPGLWYEDNYFFYTTAPWARCIHFCEEKFYCRYMRADSIMGVSLNQKTKKALDHLITRGLILQNYREQGLPPIFGTQVPAPIEAFLVKGGYIFSKGHIPKESFAELQHEVRRIIYKYGLERFRLIFGYLLPSNPLRKLFIRYRPNKVQYLFFGIPFVSQKVKNGILTTRLFGIPISKKIYSFGVHNIS